MNIKPIESCYMDRIAKQKCYYACKEEEVRQLEANYKEAIELLVKMNKEQYLYSYYEKEVIGIIEKATGKKWKELIE